MGSLQIIISTLIIIISLTAIFTIPGTIQVAEAEVDEETKQKLGYEEGKSTLTNATYGISIIFILLSLGLLFQGILNLKSATKKKEFNIIKRPIKQTSSSQPK